MLQEENRNRCRTAKLPGLGSDKLAGAFLFLAHFHVSAKQKTLDPADFLRLRPPDSVSWYPESACQS